MIDEYELPRARCDNCNNDYGVSLYEHSLNFYCVPCHEALEKDDQATFELRRMMLRD